MRSLNQLFVPTLLLAVILFFQMLEPAAGASSSPPEIMSYQGYLLDENGAELGLDSPVNYDVAFTIYDAPTGGTSIWTETQTVTVDKGYFSVELGSVSQTTSLSSVFSGSNASDRYIEIKILDLNFVVTPRLRLLPSPYAFLADKAMEVVSLNGQPSISTSTDNTQLMLGPLGANTLTVKDPGAGLDQDGLEVKGNLKIISAQNGLPIVFSQGSKTTSIGSENSDYFHFFTDLPTYWFNKPVQVA